MVVAHHKAEYIKTAPVMRELDRRGVPYRLVDLGQHSQLPVSFRTQLGVREPDLRLDSQTDAASIGDALKWAGRLMSHLRSRSHARRHVFGGMGGVCLVHGDTPSTIIATLLGRRAGVPVAHLESGLRSNSALHPFPTTPLSETCGPVLADGTSCRPDTTRPRKRSATCGPPSPSRAGRH